jgi:hypothetical protein
MIKAIRDRIIYQDPAEDTTAYARDKSIYLQKRQSQVSEAKGLIPSPAGPPGKTFGSHLPLAPETQEGEKPKKIKKRSKGVWYVPWYEDMDDMSPAMLDNVILQSKPSVLQSLEDPKIVWNPDTDKGQKSRANFTSYMKGYGVALWREEKMNEDGHAPSLPFSSSCGKPNPKQKKNTPTSGGVKGGSIGGPAYSANILGS